MTDTIPLPRRVRKRFREYPITPDPQAVPTITAVCTAGEDADCGAGSGPAADRETVARWMAEHFRDTGHATFEKGRFILRPRIGAVRSEETGDPNRMTIIARRGTWGRW